MLLRMRHCVLFFSIMMSNLPEVSGTNYYKWSAPNSSTTHMYCPNECSGLPDYGDEDSCCYCNAKPCWELNVNNEANNMVPCNDRVQALDPELVGVHRNLLLVQNPGTKSTLHELVMVDARLKNLPLNLCSFKDSLVKLDFRRNYLDNIANIECLTILDTLRLDFNKITHIPANLFSGMRQLRIFTATHNLVTTLDPFTLKILQGNIAFVDLSFNNFVTLDLTNIIRPGPFCELKLEYCDIKEQTNLQNYSLSENNVVHGPGNVIFDNSVSSVIINMTILGLDDYSDLGRYVDGSFQYFNSTLHCDCTLFPLFSLNGEQLAAMWPSLFNGGSVCSSPENMKDVDLRDISHGNISSEVLTCNIYENCPYPCDCVQVSALNRIVVNCSSRNLDELPGEMPVGVWGTYKIELLASNNHISSLDYRDYLHRTVLLDLSENLLRNVQKEAVASLRSADRVDISDQILQRLPEEMQFLEPGKVEFGINPVECDCGNLWIGNWIRLKNGHGRLLCKGSGLPTPAEETNSDFLKCFKSDSELVETVTITSCVVLAIIVLLVFLLYFFRTELLLVRRLFRTKLSGDVNGVFISFCEDNDAVFDWLEYDALPYLDIAGFSLVVPWYNLVIGEERNPQIVSFVEKCSTVVVILCKQYFAKDECVYEFDTAWTKFKNDINMNLVVVNFDNLDSRDISDPRAVAFRRLGLDVNFCNRHEKMLDALKRKIGHSGRKEMVSQGNLGNELEPTNIYEQECKGQRDNSTHVVHSVFLRLNVPKPKTAMCNCKYRKCYLHDDLGSFSPVTKSVSKVRNVHRITKQNRQSLPAIETVKNPTEVVDGTLEDGPFVHFI